MKSLRCRFVYVLFFLVVRVNGCPRKCRCLSTATYCVYKGITSKELKEIAPLIPSNTEKLYLSGNRITSISPEHFRHLQKLKFLSANFNQISELPKQLGSILPNLRMLYLTANNVKQVTSDKLEGYENIEVLNLDQNHIDEIKDFTFTKMSKLRELLFGQNRLKYIGSKTFNGLEHLIKLQLNDNEIDHIADNTFQETPKLEEIFLSDNKIKIINKNLFSSLRKLRTLYLNGNSISDIGNGAFQDLSIERINLNKNLLTKLNNNMFKGMIASGNIYLMNNPITCDCNLTLLIEKKLKGNVVKLHFGRCNSPLNMKDRLIRTITFNELNCSSCDVSTCPKEHRCVPNNSLRNHTCVPMALDLKENQSIFQKEEKRVDDYSPDYISWIVVVVCLIAIVVVTIILFIYIKNRRKKKAFEVNIEKVEPEKSPILTGLTSKNSFNVVVHAPTKMKQYFV